MRHESIKWSEPTFTKANHPLHSYSDVLGMSAQIIQSYNCLIQTTQAYIYKFSRDKLKGHFAIRYPVYQITLSKMLPVHLPAPLKIVAQAIITIKNKQ